MLSDGAVLLLSAGVVHQASRAAEELLGPCIGKPSLKVMRGFLDADASAACDAIDRLQKTGDPLNVIVRDRDGRSYELIGSPAGALIRLVIRDTHLITETLQEARHEVVAADDARIQQDWAQETVQGLISEAPIIAWHRTAEGTINWSGGEIRARHGSVSADQAVDLIVARTKLNRQPTLAGHPQKSRIEIVINEGAETVALHVTEIIRPDGSRIGFATDAGTAASAERTLTRFVQTMTETFAHLTVGLAIFDRNQTLALFNPTLVHMWQLEPAWLARRPSLRDIIDELRATRRLPELQDFHSWRARLVDLFENTEAADYEELWHLVDGSNIRVLARPHPHGSLAFIFDDVTERVRLEQRYRHSIDLRRATLDRMSEGIAVFGSNGLLQFVNQAFHNIWGTDGESVYAAMHARHLLEMCETMSEDPTVWRRLFGYITGEETRHAWSAKITKLSGDILTTRIAPLPDGSTMAVFSDVTGSETVDLALTERNGALEMAEQIRLAVTEQISDTLTAPVAKLLELSEELGAPGIKADRTKVISARIATAAQEIAADAAKIEGLTSAPVGLSDTADSPCDLRKILEFAATVASAKALTAGVTLRVTPPIPRCTVVHDENRLRQIAFHIVSDAIERCPSGTTVALGGNGSEKTFAISIVCDLPDDIEEIDGGTEIAPASKIQTLAKTDGATVEITGAPGRITMTCSFMPGAESKAVSRLAAPRRRKAENIHRLDPSAAC